jgi:hypothetical protein
MVFLFLGDDQSSYRVLFTSNNGKGSSGLAGRAGRSYTTGTSVFTTGHTYKEILGQGQVEAWHHYALVWDVNGLGPGIGDGNRKVALFLDGELESGRWYVALNQGFPPLNPSTFELMVQPTGWPGRPYDVTIDELKIWDFAKRQFSHECTEIVSIDIKPGSTPNSINPRSKGVIPVAILSDDNFDAAQVDALSVEFGPNGAKETHGQGHVEDIDGDDVPDMVLHFKTQETGIECGDTEATLTGETHSGEEIIGTDTIQTVGCK